MKTAIIGAGMAGLTVARILRTAGYEVTVFDKSKGTGGRLASRSYPGGWIDHGAPYCSAEPGFKDFLRRQLPAGIVQPWQPQVTGQLRHDEQCDLIGVPRNSAITRGLLGDLRFQPSTRIAALEAGPAGWQLFNDGGSRLGEWPLVVVAVPAPQALMLLKDHPVFAEPLERVRMAPCWVAAIRTEEFVDRWPDVAVLDHPVLRRIVTNSAKPQRGSDPIYLVQAQKSWSEQCLEEPPERVGRHLAAVFTALTGLERRHDVLFTHRWRYAFAEQPLDSPFLWEPTLRLGACGDWCLGRRVEDAWRSGTALAEQIRKECSEEEP
ncbi:MAG: NAD(P)-binding protein [Desulfuromonadales bacterium]|jgi:renalase